MIARWAALAFLLAACGRIGFDLPGEGDGDFDFTRGEPAGITVRRPSSASYVDPNGTIRYAAENEPRFDHDPRTRESLGLLVESARTNLLTDSAALDREVEWFFNGACAVTADAALAPDGTLSADEVIDLDTTDHARRGQGTAVGNETLPYSFSVFVRAATRDTVSIGAELLAGTPTLQTYMTVDLATGSVLTPPSNAAASHGVDAFPDGWYRVWLTLRNNGSGNTEALLSVWSNREAIADTGSVYAWGAQIEQGERPSSYIPTGATPVTRAADDVTSDATWIAPDRGTLRVIADVDVERAMQQPALCLGETASYACLERDGGTAAFTLYRGGRISLHGEPWPRAIARVLVAAWSDAGTGFWNGNARGSTNVQMPTGSLVRFGSDGARYLDGHLRRVTYVAERLTDAELARFGMAP